MNAFGNHAMAARVIRAQTQRMYLMEYRAVKNGFAFKVEGSTSKHYCVQLKKNGCKCSCPDFTQREEMCKHIFFILVRVAKTPLAELTSSTGDFILTNEITVRIKNAVCPTNTTDESETRITNDCGVCYEDFTEKDKDMVKCTTCSKALHDSCMSLWVKSCTARGLTNTCPYCRALLSVAAHKRMRENDDDCLVKMITPPSKQARKKTEADVLVVSVEDPAQFPL